MINQINLPAVSMRRANLTNKVATISGWGLTSNGEQYFIFTFAIHMIILQLGTQVHHFCTPPIESLLIKNVAQKFHPMSFCQTTLFALTPVPRWVALAKYFFIDNNIKQNIVEKFFLGWQWRWLGDESRCQVDIDWRHILWRPLRLCVWTKWLHKCCPFSRLDQTNYVTCSSFKL